MQIQDEGLWSDNHLGVAPHLISDLHDSLQALNYGIFQLDLFLPIDILFDGLVVSLCQVLDLNQSVSQEHIRLPHVSALVLDVYREGLFCKKVSCPNDDLG